MKQRSFRISVVTLAALGCMVTASYAIEHEFNGMLRVKADFTNFDQAGGNDGGAYNLPATFGKGTNVLSMNNLGRSFFYTEQRARLKYTGKFNGDVKLVTQFEIDSRWGDSSQFVARNQGGAMEADSINLETKGVYMEFKVPYLPTTARVGIQPVDDMYKGIFVGTDAAALTTITKLDKTTLYLGWMRGYDNKNFNGASSTINVNNAVGTVTPIGTDTAGGTNGWPGRYSLDSFMLDVKYDISKALKIGVSDYVIYENLSRNSGYNLLNTVGLNASYNFGPGVVDGFLLFQHGDNTASNFGQVGQKVSSFAANLGAKVKLGPGTMRANFLYASGDDGKGKVSAFQGLNQLGDKNTTSTFPAAQMTILITNTKYAANTDRGLINTITNYNMGVEGAFLGYDLDIDKAFIKANLGMAAVARENQYFKPKNLKTGGWNSNYVGTEINTEFGYKISENLTASLVSGYVFLGNYYKDTAYKNNIAAAANIKSPDNPWKNMVVFNLTF